MLWEKLSRIWADGNNPDQIAPASQKKPGFAAQVEEVSTLLMFLIKEGAAQSIRDQIIDDIEAARQLVKDGPEPTKEDRAKLIRAYRDLVAVQKVPFASGKVPPVVFWGADLRWPLLLVAICIAPSVVMLIAGFKWYCWAGYAVVSGLATFGFYAFTGSATNQKLNEIIRFCYVFTVLAVAASLLPFAFPTLFKGSSEAANQAPVGLLQGCARDFTSGQQRPQLYPEEVRCNDGHTQVQWILRIGGSVRHDDNTGWEVTGGLVVPMYLIVLALLGATVSMTRKVPEYQRRAMDPQDPMTNAEAREYLVFQIMQLLTAPLIAVTAYYVFNPINPQQTVLIGFASGFASQPILLMIRALVDKLSPAPAVAGLVGVTVNPASATVPVGGTMQFTVAVGGSANNQVTWLIDPPDGSGGTISQSGYYVAPGAPPTKAVTITAQSMADPTKSASAGIKVDPVVRVLPGSVNLRAKERQDFKAETFGLSNHEVDWAIDPPEAGRMEGGTYTAPDAVAEKRIVTLTARSRADASKSGKASITLQPS